MLKLLHIQDKIIKFNETYEGERDGDFYEAKIKCCKEKLLGSFLNYLSREHGIGNLISIMLKDLNRLIGALEIYIFDYIDNWGRIEYYNPDIDAIHQDAI